MDVRILQLIDGAKAARGLTVIIDVFRAFSLEAYLFDGGTKKIIPVGDETLARSLKSANPEFILAGERDGKILPGFDTGNAPSELHLVDVKGKTVVHTTSAGTQGIANAIYADEILGASLVNAKATAEYIKKSDAAEVSLVCMGWAAKYPTEEDTLCAEYIKSMLENKPFDIESGVGSLKHTSGAKFFDPGQNDVFPREDFFMCTDVDKFDFVLKLIRANTDVPFMKKEDVR
jgi:2-phosphosulfolactate phosphatase